MKSKKFSIAIVVTILVMVVATFVCLIEIGFFDQFKKEEPYICSINGEVYGINTKDIQVYLVIMRKGGGRAEVALSSELSVVDKDGNPVRVSDLQKGQPVTVKYTGPTEESAPLRIKHAIEIIVE